MKSNSIECADHISKVVIYRGTNPDPDDTWEGNETDTGIVVGRVVLKQEEDTIDTSVSLSTSASAFGIMAIVNALIDRLAKAGAFTILLRIKSRVDTALSTVFPGFVSAEAVEESEAEHE